MSQRITPSFGAGTDFSNLLSRKALLQWVREFLDKSDLAGSYWEFGVFQGESMKEAYYLLRGVVSEYVGFDSFQGLPPLKNSVDLKGADITPGLTEGNFKSLSEAFVRNNILSTGIPAELLRLVPGFFDKSLTPQLRESLASSAVKQPSVIYIDVDLYESTKQVLDFVRPLLKTGCWILFDDYWCYRGASRFGNQRAIGEFLAENRNFRFQEYASYRGWSKAFIVEVLE